MDKNLKLAEKLGLDFNIDFEHSHNQVQLIKLLTNFKRGWSNGYRVTFNPNWVRLEMDFCDMVDDCYDTKTVFGGKDLVTTTINFFEFRGCLNNSSDTRRKVTKDDCYYPDHIDDIAEDHEKIRKKAQAMNWYVQANSEYTTYLSEKDFNALADAISNPSPPNDALKALLDMPSILDGEVFFNDNKVE